ncbi:MAG: triphosphoribosyl-dephospho-CoA synthase, partial [Planctomycetota bacterium]|nr:triphosphoribosyl-dephospho-CoA synthase [Planctomycetota bacterium]
IRRKAGADAERIVQQRARGVLNLKSNPNQYAAALRKLDRDLRVSGNRLNPGTTADLVTASLFLALSEGVLQIPLEMDLLCDKYNPRP